MPGLYWMDGNAGMPQLQQLDSRALSHLADKMVPRLHQSCRSPFPSECLGLHCARYRYFPESSLNDTAAKLGGRRYSLAVIAPRHNRVQNSGGMDAEMTRHEGEIAVS